MKFFAPMPARQPTGSAAEIDSRYSFLRYRQVAAMLVVYALFYVCRLAFSATKKTLIEQGLYSAQELGYVGAAMYAAYAIGKCLHGFLADHVNVRRYIGFGLFVTAFANMLVGFHMPALVLIVVWFVNGFAQATGAPCCVVSLSRWFTKRERGTYYGIWSCSHNLGEAIAYVCTSIIMVYVASHFGVDWGWRSGFWGAAFFGFCGVGLISLLFLDSPESVALPPVATWKHEPMDVAEKLAAGDVKKGQRLALTNWAVWMIALSGGLFSASRYAITEWGIFVLELKTKVADTGALVPAYSNIEATEIIALNSVVGAFSAFFSGIVSDRFFKGSRNELVLIAGLLNVAGLSLLMLVPGYHPWVHRAAMVLFGLAVGVLLTFLGGLMAVDLVPRLAAGAALGIVGLVSYLGAGIQNIVSGYLVTKDAVTGKAALLSHTFANGYVLSYMSIFWIGMALASMICALSVWRKRPQPEGEK